MGTWKERGRDNVRRLLARMGLPLRDCQQPWKQMSPRQKRDLSSKLEEFAPQFRLAELRYPSFQLEDGYRVCMGAADHVHAVTALLEVGQGALDADLDAEERFWLAYRALGPAKGAGGDGNDLLLTGLGRGRQLHQAVVQVGGSHIQAGTIMRASRFRYLNLADSGNALDSELMAHVLALQRLSLFLQEAYEHMGKAAIPVVVVGPKSEGGFCLVVAATGSTKGGQLLNRLSVMFRKAADEIGAQIRQSSFDSSAIEIPAKDVPRFLDELILDET
jgi:cell division control protein 45